MAGAAAIERGCGTRVRGGVYAEIGVGPHGIPIEEGLVDPPVPVDTESLGVTPRGVSLIQGEGPNWILDWIGCQDYPNVLDFYLEANRFGISRRIPRNFDFHSLDQGTILGLIHSRAYIGNPRVYWENVRTGADGLAWCPTRNGEHRAAPEHDPHAMCAALWWEDVEGGIPVEPGTNSRVVKREMPSFGYFARHRPQEAAPVYTPALWFRWTIHRLVVIEDPARGEHEQALGRARMASIPVDLVGE